MPDSSPAGRLLRVVGWLLTTIASLVALYALWPAPLGGWARFVVVHGTSMEPTYHSGDLLYTRSASAPEFAVGDTAVYRIPDGQPGAGRMVVHRIHGLTASGRYVMQGDNRPDDDGALPGAGDLVARPIVDLGPAPARILLLIPWTMLVVVVVTFGWYLWPRSDDEESAEDEGVAPDEVADDEVGWDPVVSGETWVPVPAAASLDQALPIWLDDMDPVWLDDLQPELPVDTAELWWLPSAEPVGEPEDADELARFWHDIKRFGYGAGR